MYLDNLIIQSPQEFYLKLKDIKIPNLTPFVDKMDLFINGCSCDAELHWDYVEAEYKNLSKISLDDLKKKLNVDFIYFHLNNEFLFKA